MVQTSSISFQKLKPLPYQCRVVDYLKTTEPELWEWASSAEVVEESARAFRTEMLKTSYRLDAEAHPELAERCAAVMERLELTDTVTFYHGPGDMGMNAMLHHLPGEAHILFTGPILSTLNGAELDALLGHELAHQRLWTIDNGDYLTADRLLSAATSDPRATSSHFHTLRRFRLYTEIFADRGALLGSGQLDAAIAALVKTETGVREVSAASYLRQAEEIFLHEGLTTQGIDHPETFVRARALRFWAENAENVDSWLASVIDGQLDLDSLDLTDQRRLSQLTHAFLRAFLRPRWMRTDLMVSHARTFFSDFDPSSSYDHESLLQQINDTLKSGNSSVGEYFSYLLLDFALIDPSLEDLPLAAAIQFTEQLEISDVFEKLVLKETAIKKKQLTKVKKQCQTMLEKADAQI